MKINLILVTLLLCSILSYGQSLSENTKKLHSKGMSGIGIDFEHSQFSGGPANTRSFTPSFRYQYFVINGLAIGGKINTRFSDYRVFNAQELNETNREVGLAMLARYYPIQTIGLFTEIDGGISVYNLKRKTSTINGITTKLGISAGYTFVFNRLPRFSFEPKLRLGVDERIEGIPENTRTGADAIVSIGIRYNFGKPLLK